MSRFGRFCVAVLRGRRWRRNRPATVCRDVVAVDFVALEVQQQIVHERLLVPETYEQPHSKKE